MDISSLSPLVDLTAGQGQHFNGPVNGLTLRVIYVPAINPALAKIIGCCSMGVLVANQEFYRGYLSAYQAKRDSPFFLIVNQIIQQHPQSDRGGRLAL